MQQIDGETVETVTEFIWAGAPKSLQMDFANKCPSNQGYGFSSGHVWMWELDCDKNWVPKNWFFWTVVLEKTLESPLDCKEIQPVQPKGDQSWVFFGRNDDKADTLYPPSKCAALKDKLYKEIWASQVV